MFNMNLSFLKFVKQNVDTNEYEITCLIKKMEKEILNLQKGIEYSNSMNYSSYKLLEEPFVQGSIAMKTTVNGLFSKNDIDISLVFDKDEIDKSPVKAKKALLSMLRPFVNQSETNIDYHTNCIRCVYRDGSHADLAVYRRYKLNSGDADYIYEHGGSKWRFWEPRKIVEWFHLKNEESGGQLRIIVKLLKMFCKSRKHWRMPGGIILTILAVENYRAVDRIDEAFYIVMRNIIKRLKRNKEISNPLNQGQSLIRKKEEEVKVENLYKRLFVYVTKLDDLFKEDCTCELANTLWGEFFNHPYWNQTQHNKMLAAKF
ncbi:nucleotidyltransferase [Bacillus sp. XT-2]|nr:nucleotidyltransferase [Bacillus sp. XT-2]MCV0023407.1 nucleotidyltransferase [Bacillus sp. XT-2]MCV0025694.1 nucleotidyltransferase [Bacillus sp. XT-2]